MEATPRKFSKGTVVLLTLGAYVWRPLTHEEYLAWEASDDSKGMDDAGETKLPPKSVYHYPNANTPYKITQARKEAPQGYGNPVSGCCELVDGDGVYWYTYRKNLR